LGSQRHFVVHARFVDWRAFRAHAETPHFNRMLPRLTSLLASPVSMEIFLEV
jgi:quinol monooxygenase YgiN